MAEILRITARWNGFQGAPGYTNFHFREFSAGLDQQQYAAQAADRVAIFFNECRTLLPAGVQIQVQGEAALIEETNGEMQDIIGFTPPALILTPGTNLDGYAAAVGAVITWRTRVVRKGRRIKGRTFIVPLKGDAYGSDGTLSLDTVGQLNTAANNLNDDTKQPDFGVYARPTRTKNADGSVSVANDGLWASVESHSVPDMGAVLRSRRD
jgi:hypothetical protein